MEIPASPGMDVSNDMTEPKSPSAQNVTNDVTNDVTSVTDDGEDGSLRLKRNLGLLPAVSYVAGGIIGVGIFVSPQTVLLNSGGSVGVSLAVWVFCAVIAFCGALTYAEYGSRIRKSGGSYTYVREAWGDGAGFVFLWTQLVVTRPMATALGAMTAAEYALRPVFLQCPHMVPRDGKVLLALCILEFSRRHETMATGVTMHGRTTPGGRSLASSDPERERTASRELEDDEDDDGDTEAEVRLEGEELFMTLTAEEEASWRAMMDKQGAVLATRNEISKARADGFTRRRMFAYSRIRKLQEKARQRGVFFGDLADYVSAMEAKVKAKKKSTRVTFEDTVVGVEGGEDKAPESSSSSPSGGSQPAEQGAGGVQQEEQQQQQTANQESVQTKETVAVKRSGLL